jgi:gamma-D-glutamyl-L-lysine dipeptidyl-peptidase
VIRDRRRLSGRLGAHPERRVLAATLRAALRGAAAPLTPRARAARRAVVLPPVVNMYARPSATTPVVSQATLGTRVVVLRRRGGWALAETPDRYRGWIRAGALRHDRRDAVLYEVASLFANVYAARDVTARAPIAVLPILARVEAAGGRPPGDAARDWLRVLLPDGRRGWAQRADLRDADGGGTKAGGGVAADARPAAITATALRFVGLPYLWGGTTPFGLDCSGLVQLVHRLHGVLLPRDADQQFADRRLRPVARPRVQAADLVFFGPRAGAITHVGIALGSRAFVNATTHGAPVVRIDCFDVGWWRGLYRGARRLPRPG